MYCNLCGGALYHDLEGVEHCVRCEAAGKKCPACGGRGHREIRSRIEICKWCEGRGSK